MRTELNWSNVPPMDMAVEVDGRGLGALVDAIQERDRWVKATNELHIAGLERKLSGADEATVERLLRRRR
jgi:hypothetical protein